MSTDYFGALLRSAGRVASASSSSGLVEVDVEREPGGFSVGAGIPARPGVGREGPVSSSTSAVRPVASSPLSLAAPRSLNEAPLPTAGAAPDGRSLVHAAMAWVASDPQGRAPASVATPQAARFSLDVEDVHREQDAAPVPHGDRSNDHDDDDDRVVPVDPEVHQRSSSSSSYAHRAALLRPSAAAALPHEERVEISIGTIHLHVDAPPSPSVAAAAPAPAPAAPSLRPPTPRSSLSRRALYRL